MTTEEKRMQLTVFCSARSCSRCPLRRGFKCGDGESFLKKKDDGSYSMGDRTVEKAYELAIGSKKSNTAKAAPASSFHGCPYAVGLQCDSPDDKCSSCGWNPAIDEIRRAKLAHIFTLPPNKLGLHGLRLKKKRYG